MPGVVMLAILPLRDDPRARRAAEAAECANVPVEGLAVGAPRRRTTRRRRLPRELRGLARLTRLAIVTGVLASRRVRSASGVTVVHAHDLDTLPAGWLLARRHRARLVYDAHELYTGFDLDPPRLWLASVRRLEGLLARRADAVVTVSDPIADELVERLRLAKRPYVVLNAPPVEGGDVESHAGRLRVIYQAAVGPGRHIEDLPVLDDVELFARVLGATAAPPHVTSLVPVPPNELVSALASFDVGLVIDRPETENTRLALPNKLFEYLMAGLAVVVPSRTVMAELVEREGVGTAFEPGQLGDTLRSLAENRVVVEEMRRRARAAAVERYNAEAQRPALFAAWGL